MTENSKLAQILESSELDEENNNVNKTVVMVTGCSGKVGSAVVKYLSKHHSNLFNIKAGTRNPEKCKHLESLEGVEIVKAEMGDELNLRKAFDGVKYLFLISPTIERRTIVTLRTLDAAKDAKIDHIVFLSVFYADINDLIIGSQFKSLEAKLVCMPIGYTVLRVAMFLDHHYQLKELLTTNSQFSYPLQPDRRYTPVAILDICRAVAAVFQTPGRFTHKIYHLASDRFSMAELAKEFGSALKKRVTYKPIPYEVALSQYLEVPGHEAWQGDALMEFYRGIDAGADWANRRDISDFTAITGEKPTSIRVWCAAVAEEIRSKNLRHLRHYGGGYRRGYRGYRRYSVASTLSQTQTSPQPTEAKPTAQPTPSHTHTSKQTRTGTGTR